MIIFDNSLRPEQNFTLVNRFFKRKQEIVGAMGSILTTKKDWLFKKLERNILMQIINELTVHDP